VKASASTAASHERPCRRRLGEAWYGKWRVDGRQVKRRLGDKKGPPRPTPHGLTARQAEVALREAMAARTADELARLASDELRVGRTIGEVGEAYLPARDLKASTATDYRMHLRVHLVRFFAGQTIERIDAAV